MRRSAEQPNAIVTPRIQYNNIMAFELQHPGSIDAVAKVEFIIQFFGVYEYIIECEVNSEVLRDFIFLQRLLVLGLFCITC